MKAEDVKKLPQRIGTTANSLNVFLKLIAETHTIVGLVMIAMALAILDKPSVGAAANLASWGVSPRGFALTMAISGALILRFPKTRYYGILTMPFLLYMASFIDFVAESDTAWTPVAIYLGFWLLALRAGIEDA